MKLEQDTIEQATRRTLQNVQAVLQAAGSDLDKVLKATVYLNDLGDFAAMNAVYTEFFPENPPARTCFQVGELPLGAAIEIEVIAHQ